MNLEISNLLSLFFVWNSSLKLIPFGVFQCLLIWFPVCVINLTINIYWILVKIISLQIDKKKKGVSEKILLEIE